MDPQNQDNQQAQQVAQAMQFVDELINQKFADKINEVTPETREELRKDILMRLDEFVMSRVIAKLSDEDLATFENMIKEGKSNVEMQEFITQHVPDFVTFATDAFIEFRNVYLGEEK